MVRLRRLARIGIRNNVCLAPIRAWRLAGALGILFWVDQRTDQPGNQMLINIVPTTMRTTLKKFSNCHYDGDGDSGTDDDSMAFRNELVALLYEHVSLTSQ